MYCKNLLTYSRRHTIAVNIGNILMGGENEIRLQSMTNTNTLDTEATVAQTIRIAKKGAHYVRITAPTSREAEHLAIIKTELLKQNCNVPIIADIHFSPKAAEIAAKNIEKVRINPGNYIDTKKFKQIDSSNEEYNAEVEKIKEKFIPLINICKENGTAMRIGTNHASLSDRIMSKYGDSPLGMVESTLEFLRICVTEKYFNVVISLKAGNPIVMIHAYRLLVKKMQEERMEFPLHLGVTEAGEGDDGRIKSAIGIGSILADGIGDTIRVSLTEDPEAEIPVAQIIANIFEKSNMNFQILDSNIDGTTPFYSPYEFSKRKSFAVENVGGSNIPIVIANIENFENINQNTFELFGYKTNSGKLKKEETAPDYFYVGNNKTQKTEDYINIIQNKNSNNKFQYIELNDYNSSSNLENQIRFVSLGPENVNSTNLQKIKNDKSAIIVAEISKEKSAIHQTRYLFFVLEKENIKNPVILKYKIKTIDEYNLIKVAAESGSIFIDGLGDGLWIDSEQIKDNKKCVETSFRILQACRVRITKTEYISCPSCGRTLFDLQETAAKIREKTSHLKGLKIGIMGCIVNGPGEMADADYGYVGTGHGKVTLYKQKEIVKKNIPQKTAVEELINLLKENNDWIEPS